MAFDRPHYQKLIPNHLRDLAEMPSDVMRFLESGAFVCRCVESLVSTCVLLLWMKHMMMLVKFIRT